MTTNNEAFEKWYKNSTNLLAHGAPVYHSLKDAWQAATTEANKRIAELEVQLQNWKDFSKKVQKIDFNDYLQLQASNNDLREALEKTATKVITDGNPSTTYLYEDIHTELATTPAQSLIEHDNEVIEKCAKVCEENFKPFTYDAVAEAIRALKEVK